MVMLFLFILIRCVKKSTSNHKKWPSHWTSHLESTPANTIIHIQERKNENSRISSTGVKIYLGQKCMPVCFIKSGNIYVFEAIYKVIVYSEKKAHSLIFNHVWKASHKQFIRIKKWREERKKHTTKNRFCVEKSVFISMALASLPPPPLIAVSVALSW